MYKLEYTYKSIKQLQKLEKNIRVQYAIFFDTLMDNPFIGKLDDVTYHAHVKYHWVAVWKVNKINKTVTVIYIGSREGAPY